MIRRVIVTGGTGFVGANLARRVLAEGHDVHLLVRPGFNPWRIEEIRRQVRLHEVSLEDPDGVARVVAEVKPQWVFHLAAYGAYSRQTDVRQMVLTNVVGTMNLVEACLRTGVETLVNTGSSSEYGFKDHAPSETDWLEPNSHYAVTKASATLFSRYTGQGGRILLPTLRLYSVYGPYEEPDRLLPTVILHGLTGELPPLVQPDVARDYVHVDDVCTAYLSAASGPGREPGAVYNVGTGVQTTLREVVEVAQRLLSIVAQPVWGSLAPRSWDTNVWVADTRKIRSELGWRPRVKFEKGLRRMVEWFKEHPSIQDVYRAHGQRFD